MSCDAADGAGIGVSNANVADAYGKFRYVVVTHTAGWPCAIASGTAHMSSSAERCDGLSRAASSCRTESEKE